MGHALTYEIFTADGRCAIEPYLRPGALIAYNSPRGFNQAANKLRHDCVNEDINGGGTIFGTGMLGFASYIPINAEYVISLH